MIYGDYDVDGITSTAILYQFLSDQGAEVDFYIPNRSDEGYGINMLALQKIKKDGAKLLVTVDCGITAVGEVEFAKAIGSTLLLPTTIPVRRSCRRRTRLLTRSSPTVRIRFRT